MRRYNPVVLGLGAIAIILLIAVLVLARGRGGDEATGNEVAASRGSQPGERCGSQATYDRIKLELFRQAARIRNSDQATFDRLATYSVVRVEQPLLRDLDEELGTIRCTGRLSLDLPPGVAVVGGRRTLSADIDYVLQPAADATGDVVMLEGIDPITIPLATLARTGETAQLPPAPPTAADRSMPGTLEPLEPQPPSQAEPVEPPPVTAPPTAPTASARPSFNCRYARSRSEIAVCTDGGLAALDRQMASQYYRAVSRADASQRRLLTTTRDAFLRYRNRCSTNACIAASYRDRMREIGDIMSGGWRPNR